MNISEEELQTRNIDVVNSRLVDPIIKFQGDYITISLVVQLLAYIRYAIKSNLLTEIRVKIGNNVINTPFDFTVNNEEIRDLVSKPDIEIN